MNCPEGYVSRVILYDLLTTASGDIIFSINVEKVGMEFAENVARIYSTFAKFL